MGALTRVTKELASPLCSLLFVNNNSLKGTGKKEETLFNKTVCKLGHKLKLCSAKTNRLSFTENVFCPSCNQVHLCK